MEEAVKVFFGIKMPNEWFRETVDNYCQKYSDAGFKVERDGSKITFDGGLRVTVGYDGWALTFNSRNEDQFDDFAETLGDTLKRYACDDVAIMSCSVDCGDDSSYSFEGIVSREGLEILDRHEAIMKMVRSAKERFAAEKERRVIAIERDSG